ncbi:MAG TPA: CRTAC1 family protein [Terriglobales bacterium]|nr:CRTAC1 family protein [Terriglobales bacterium]
MPAAPVQFTDVALRAGLGFRHHSGASPEKYVLETMGSGAAFLDYDNDGWLDIYLVNGGSVPGYPASSPIRNALYRNRGDGTFEDVTAAAGVAGNGHYGMGSTAADYDGDGYTDLFVTAFGRNVLYHNRGNRTFEDVTDRAGVAGGQWSTSATFLDYDRDGDLDLFVARYVDFDFSRNRICGDPVRRIRGYCHPDVYDGLTNLLYRNNGDGTFTDVSEASGIAAEVGKGLGVVAADFDQDGWIDLYVANDSMRSFLFRNRGNGTFEEIGVRAGVAFDDGGRPQAGMGTAAGDYDDDGRLDLVKTNLDREYNNLYRNLGGTFADISYAAGFGPPSIPLVGWGTDLFDYDNDSDLDVLVVNGHVIDNVKLMRPESRYPQPKLLFENQGSRLREVAAAHGHSLQVPRVSRGAAFGDYDNDGDVDVLVLNLGGSPELLRNDGGNRASWLTLSLEGVRSPRDPIGACVRATVAGRTQFRCLNGGGSYLSSSDHRIHLGMGDAVRAERVEIRWPSGTVDVLQNLAARKRYHVREGQGIVQPPANPSGQRGGAAPRRDSARAR